MPKGIGYGEAGKASKLGFFSKKKKKKEKKKSFQTKATKEKIRRLKEAGMDDATIKRLLDKGAK